MMITVSSHLLCIMNEQLLQLGWQGFFQQQLTLEEWDNVFPARVLEQARSELTLGAAAGQIVLPVNVNMPTVVVGDWLLLDSDNLFVRLLERKSCFARKAAGSELKRQLISANVDTAFIVTSMNDDFNINRLERFLILANEAGAEPVVLLSKADLTDDGESYLQRIAELDKGLAVEAINALDNHVSGQLSPWLKAGNTIAVLGSSGVGKSTLINSLMGKATQATGGIREDDAKGRHTTTGRSLLPLPCGALVLDTPGMREIQLVDSQEGIAKTFHDIEQLAKHCRFSDCQHQAEPGCAVQKALASGEIDQRRLANYQKLLREERINSASLAERRSNDKALGKMYKRVQSQSRDLKGR
jgi:ribosome biogenesis GTPase